MFTCARAYVLCVCVELISYCLTVHSAARLHRLPPGKADYERGGRFFPACNARQPT